MLPAWASQYQSVRPSSSVYIVAKEGKMGITDRKGTRLTQFEYDTIYNFHEGIAIVGKGKREVNQFGKVLSDFKYGYINQAGQLVVPTKYEYVEDFSEGVGYVLPSLHDDLWFDKQGKIALALGDLSHAESFRGNMAYINIAKVGFREPPDYPGQPNPLDVRGNYIDHQGRLLVPWKYDTIAPYFVGYLRPVRKNGKWGFLDSLARVVVRLQYDDIDQDSAYFWQNLRRVGLAGRYGFIDPRSGRVIVPLQYEASKPSQSSYIWVSQHGKWGCLSKRDKLIIPFAYDDVRPFEGNLSAVKKGNKWGLLDTTGKVVTPLQYEAIFAFVEDRAVVKHHNKFGFVNISGREVIPAVYSKVSPFTAGQAYATRWGLFIRLAPDGHWLGFKLDPGTLTLIVIVLLIVLAVSYYWWTRRQVALRNAI